MMLLIEIDRFLRNTGISPSRFGREAINDPKLIKELRAGRQLRERTRRRVRAYLRRDPRP